MTAMAYESWSCAYDTWGNVTSHTGNTTDNPYQFVGQFGYYTLMQTDPAKDGSNWYLYGNDQPTDTLFFMDVSNTGSF